MFENLVFDFKILTTYTLFIRYYTQYVVGYNVHTLYIYI